MWVPLFKRGSVENAEQMQKDYDEDRHAGQPQDDVAEHCWSPLRWLECCGGGGRQTRTSPALNCPDGAHLSVRPTTLHPRKHQARRRYEAGENASAPGFVGRLREPH